MDGPGVWHGSTSAGPLFAWVAWGMAELRSDGRAEKRAFPRASSRRTRRWGRPPPRLSAGPRRIAPTEGTALLRRAALAVPPSHRTVGRAVYRPFVGQAALPQAAMGP